MVGEPSNRARQLMAVRAAADRQGVLCQLSESTAESDYGG